MPTPVAPTGNQVIDGLLWGWKWDKNELTVSFPDSLLAYFGKPDAPEYRQIEGFEPFTNLQADQIVEFALSGVSVFADLTFVYDRLGLGDLRFAQADQIDYGPAHFENGLHVPGGIGSAEANPPDQVLIPAYARGDNWFTPDEYDAPLLGSFQYAAGLLHEFGHSLGLKHGHTPQPWSVNGVDDGTLVFPTLPPAVNSQEYSIMTYLPYVGADLDAGVSGAEEYPWTFMMFDIAALQHMYGANYGEGSNNGDTVYRFDPITGRGLINDLVADIPYNQKILLTIWDGGGADLYDFSNYDTDQVVSLAPGDFSTFSPDQLSDLSFGTGIENIARGNLANALIYNNDLRSLIENVTTGSGNDIVMGNIVGNHIVGLGGNDRLFGEGFEAAHDMQTALQVYRLFQTAFDRNPERQQQNDLGLSLIKSEVSLPELATAVIESPEFQNTNSMLDDAAFVELLYRNALGRAPDADERQGWLDQLSSGASRGDVALGIAESPAVIEATTIAGVTATMQNSATFWSDDVYRLYQATLDRDPDSAGFLNWVLELANGRSLESMTDEFVRSAEFENTYGTLDDAGFVEQLYQNVLGRAADAEGLQFWIDTLATDTIDRAAIVQGFSQSAEFIDATRDDIAAWMRSLDDKTDRLEGGAGNNVLAGGVFSDIFIFSTAEPGVNRIVDMEAWDGLALAGFGYTSASEAIANMTQQGEDVVFSDQDVTVVIANRALDEITEDMLLL